MPEIPNPTNHLRPAEGGAFVLPSIGRVPVLPPPVPQMTAKALQPAIKPDLAHEGGVRPEAVTSRQPNSEVDCCCADGRVWSEWSSRRVVAAGGRKAPASRDGSYEFGGRFT